MSQIFSATGFRALRASWILLGLSLVATATIVAGSLWFLEREKRDGSLAQQRLRDARSRLDAVRRERDNLAESAEVFRSLAARGILAEERRIDLIEMVGALRKRHQLAALEYEILPQRPLPGASYGSVDVLSSRVKLRIRALHEGDVLALLDDLARAPRGLYPLDRCTFKRIAAAPNAVAAHVEADCQMQWITLKEKPGGGRPG